MIRFLSCYFYCNSQFIFAFCYSALIRYKWLSSDKIWTCNTYYWELVQFSLPYQLGHRWLSESQIQIYIATFNNWFSLYHIAYTTAASEILFVCIYWKSIILNFKDYCGKTIPPGKNIPFLLPCLFLLNFYLLHFTMRLTCEKPQRSLCLVKIVVSCFSMV